MELQKIKTFLTIVKLGNFQRAANELQYAQSTITMQIQRLEQQLGLKLFKRGKKISLTEAGIIFSEQTLPIMKSLEQLQYTMTDFLHGDSGSINIGVIEPSASFYLPKILFPFVSSHPKIHISIKVGYTHNFCELIHKQEMDFAICAVPEFKRGLHFEPLFSEPLMLLIPEKHHLFKKEKIYIEDLKSQRFLTTLQSCPYRKKLETTLQELGNPYSVIEISNLVALKYYVQANYGLAFLPSTIVFTPFPGTATRSVENFSMNLLTGILYNDNSYSLNMAGRRLIEHVKQGFKDNNMGFRHMAP